MRTLVLPLLLLAAALPAQSQVKGSVGLAASWQGLMPGVSREANVVADLIAAAATIVQQRLVWAVPVLDEVATRDATAEPTFAKQVTLARSALQN